MSDEDVEFEFELVPFLIGLIIVLAAVICPIGFIWSAVVVGESAWPMSKTSWWWFSACMIADALLGWCIFAVWWDKKHKENDGT